jgi:phage terminase large subunit
MTLDWPPNYIAELQRRINLETAIARDPVLLAGALAHYAENIAAFASDCCWLHEPRNANVNEPVLIPVVLFPRQEKFLNWLVERYRTRSSAPVEKSRDSGATWMSCVFAVWLWLFHEGSVTGFGSRKEILVDRQGDMTSIFEKIRSLISKLPHYLVPAGFKPAVHSNYMRIIHPTNGASIVGEAGDNIGRGGRTSIYIVDEAAYIERPDLLEASLSATTDVRIDISSPRVGTLFHEYCATSPEKFIFDVRDAPWHTAEWAEAKKRELESRGMGHVYKREFLRDATAGLSGQVIDAEWIEAAVGAYQRMRLDITNPGGKKIAALDVADGGADSNALVIRHGPRVLFLERRRDLRADEAAAWAYAVAADHRADELRYDSVGVGAGASAALRGKKEVKEIVAWSGGDGVLYPRQPWDGGDGRSNADMFANLKAQAWWHLRARFLETYKASRGEGHDPDMVISLDASLDLRELKSELAQVLYKHNANGKILIDKTPSGYRSPNLADAIMMAFAPASLGIEIIGIF